MNYIFKDLKPEKAWKYFWEILQIPHASKKEEKIIKYIVDFGKHRKLETLQDKTGNVLIRKPATKGMEKLKSVVLQGHLDMVCEKNSDIKHNFDKDAIKPVIVNGWVKAKGTTLGADNGIGIAAMLALLDSKNIKHGPIECLFTVDEETGLTGAFGLKANFLKSNILLNLDSEDDGQFFIGCAGGINTVASLIFRKERITKNFVAFKISVLGLKGGHSGDNINDGLGNSIKIINRLLWNAHKNYGLRISDIKGGNLRNAIPREAFADVVIPKENKNEFLRFVMEFEEMVKAEYSTTAPNLRIFAKDSELPNAVMDEETQEKLLNSLYACPHGVIAMSAEIPNFVETSTNLAVINIIENNKLFIQTSQRSSIKSSKQDVADMVASSFKLAGFEIEVSGDYPGWKPNTSSEIKNIMVKSYKKLFKKQAKVLAIHAGLECGVIGEKYPGMDMISFGPTIKDPHSPDERLNISTVEPFWDLLLDVLKNIPKEKK